jgi:predicted kinase
MAKQFLLVGIPFSGKTTLGRELAQRLGFVHVNLDQIKSEKGYGKTPDDNVPDEAWKEIFQELDLQVLHALHEGKNVVNETAWVTREWRDKARQAAKAFGYETSVIYLNIPTEVAKARQEQNKKTGERYATPDFEFDDYVNQFEKPSFDEDVIFYDQTTPLEEWIAENDL